MAATYTLTGARWNLRRLSALLESWATRAPVPLLTKPSWARLPAGPWTWLFPEGGVRGCSLLVLPGLVQARGLQLRLNLMAGRADWMVAHALLRTLLEAGGGSLSGPDEAPVAAEALREPEAGLEALARLREDAARTVRPLREGKPYVALPNPEFTLFVTPELLPDEREETRFAMALEEELAEMATRYATAARVPVIELPDGSGLSVWSQDAALIHLTHYVGVRRGESASQGVVLSGPALLDALGDRVEVVSQDQDRFYLPALDPQDPADARVLERLAKAGESLDDWVARLGGPHADNALPSLYGTRRPTPSAR